MKRRVCEIGFWICYYMIRFIDWLLPIGSSIKIKIFMKIVKIQNKLLQNLPSFKV